MPITDEVEVDNSIPTVEAESDWPASPQSKRSKGSRATGRLPELEKAVDVD